MPTITTCASCQAAIFWAVTRTGKSMPIDAEPVATGNLRLLPAAFPPIVTMNDQLELGEIDDGVRYVTHFSTCPHAERWRGGRPRPAATPGPRIRPFRRS